MQGVGGGNIPYLQPSPSPLPWDRSVKRGFCALVLVGGEGGDARRCSAAAAAAFLLCPHPLPSLPPPPPGVSSGAGSTAVRPGRPAALISASVNWAATGREKTLRVPPCLSVLGNSWALKLTCVSKQMGFLLCRMGDPELTAPAQRV